MSRGTGGGWHTAAGTVGGLTRTYGMHRHFEEPAPGSCDEPGQVPRIDWKRIVGYFRPYLRQWVAILATTLGMAGLSVLPPLLVAILLDRALPHGDLRLLLLLPLAMVGLAVISGFMGVWQQTLTAKVSQGVMVDLREELYLHLQRMSLHFYTVTQSGDIVSRINNDVSAVQSVATGTVVTIASNAATLVFAAITMWSMNRPLTLLAVALFPAFYLPAKIVGKIRRRLSTQTLETQASMLAFLNERMHVSGALLSNIFGQRGADAQVFATHSTKLSELNIKQAVVGRWLYMVLTVFSATGPALVYWYGGYQVVLKHLSTGHLIAFAALLTLLYRPLAQLAGVYADVQAAAAVFERIFAYLDMTPEVQDKPQAIALEHAAGPIIFHDVTFSYPKRSRPRQAQPAQESHRPALQHVNFEIRPGQKVALVGPSGAGKTTITYLLPRFYDPDAGRVTLDGHDLRDLDQEALRRHIGMVTQETFLFHDTIRTNLMYARPDASESAMIDACRAASIHDFIAALPEGYDTVVGERGFRLSGGEKQRISIARALLKDPAILILDEATSNLDATSEYLIQAALETLLRGRTSLIIAHRLSTILSADKILVLDVGHLVESGSHQELIQKGGLYARLFEQQFKKALDLNVGAARVTIHA